MLLVLMLLVFVDVFGFLKKMKHLLLLPALVRAAGRHVLVVRAESAR
jgi:hypothetical protein